MRTLQPDHLKPHSKDALPSPLRPSTPHSPPPPPPQGSANVLESNHIVIIGWNDQLHPLLAELALAEESEGGCTIAVLSEMEKDEMEKSIEQAALDLKGSIVVCRKVWIAWSRGFGTRAAPPKFPCVEVFRVFFLV